MIALKECAYYLLLYGDQHDGLLDDGSSYRLEYRLNYMFRQLIDVSDSDEDYHLYYPEIQEIREEVLVNGEFNREFAVVTGNSFITTMTTMKSDIKTLEGSIID